MRQTAKSEISLAIKKVELDHLQEQKRQLQSELNDTVVSRDEYDSKYIDTLCQLKTAESNFNKLQVQYDELTLAFTIAKDDYES